MTLATPRKPGKVIRLNHITRDMLRLNPTTLFLFGDNMTRRGLGGQAAEMRGEPNAVGVPTKWSPKGNPSAMFYDEQMDLVPEVRSVIRDALNEARMHLKSGGNVAIPTAGLGTGLARLDETAPRLLAFINSYISGLEDEASEVLRPDQPTQRVAV